MQAATNLLKEPNSAATFDKLDASDTPRAEFDKRKNSSISNNIFNGVPQYT